MLEARTSSRPDRTRWAQYLAAGALLLSAIVPAACEPPPSQVAPSQAPPLHTNPAVAARVGRAALRELGYEKIMQITLEAGWIWYPPPQSGNALGQAEAAWPLFTRYAVSAGVVSQVDSPAPGPADVVALGILVIGLVHAGLVAASIVSAAEDAPITGPTAAPPVPVARPTSGPVPTVIPTAIPTAVATSDPRDDELSSCEILRNMCISNPRQPEWNRRKFGTRKDCFSCYRICKEKGVWPSDKCPRDWQN